MKVGHHAAFKFSSHCKLLTPLSLTLPGCYQKFVWVQVLPLPLWSVILRFTSLYKTLRTQFKMYVKNMYKYIYLCI